MGDTQYFIFNHAAAFAECSLDGAVWQNNAVRPTDGNNIGRFITPTLDSREKDNVWQRLLADAVIPDGGRIRWHIYAFNNEATRLAATEFVADNTTDFIPIGVEGRYAVLEAEISGGAEIRSLQIFSVWESFLDYLPEIYRDYNSFSDRFLRLFTTAYLDLEQKIEKAPSMFNPAVASDKQLRWLAEVVGVPHISLWETEGLRKLLISGIYKRRGQFSVFADYIQYFTGYRPYIVENFRFLTGQPENDRLYANGDVTIFLPPEAASAEIDMDVLELIIADFLPEDLVWRVLILNSNPIVSGYAYLGINTQIADYSGIIIGKSRIGSSFVGG